jgi:serine phosphatase RsbU (regulator of sigma subunit)
MGGDFFDVFALPGGRVAVVIGDASGKGLAAAIRTTEIKYALRVFLRETASPGVALERVNRFVYEARALEQREGNAFLVLSVMVIDPASGRAEFAAAGAEPPLLFRADGSSEAVDAGGVPLGILPDEAYASAERRLAQDDTVLFVTDGITEARRGDRFFWENGLTELTSDVLQGMPLRRAGQAILDGARAFAGGTLQDDACLLLVQRRDPPPA